MIIWSGLGFLVPVIVFTFSLLAEVITRHVTGSTTYYQENTTPLKIAFLISAITIFILGRWLNRRRAKIFIEKETGKEVVLGGMHSLFFVPFEYWGVILVAVTIVLTVKEIITF